MKNRRSVNTVVILQTLLLSSCIDSKTAETAWETHLEPTEIPRPFFEGQISLENVVQWNSAFSNDGGQIVFTIAEQNKPSYLVESQWKDSAFTIVEPVFEAHGFPDSDPHVTNQGELIFISARPFFEGDTTRRNYHLWKAQKSGGDWSKPVRISNWSDFDNGLFYPGTTKNGDLYFSYKISPDSRDADVFFSQKTSAGYKTPVRLPSPLNSPEQESDPFVEPNGKYIIFAGFNRPVNYGKSDLYISFRKRDTWTEPKNLGAEVNSTGYDGSPYVTPNGRYLIFTSSRTKDGTSGEDYFNVFYVSFNSSEYL